MQKKQSAKKRVQKFLTKLTQGKAQGWGYGDAPDERQQSKVDHSMPSILWALELGLTSNQTTLRDVEEMSVDLGPAMRSLIPSPLSDSTLYTEVQRLDVDYLLDKLAARIRGFHRSKMLAPLGLPFGVMTVDGKNLATLDHDADGTGHKRSKKNKKWHLDKTDEATRGKSYFLMPALRATLTSAEAKPCVYQVRLPPGVGESSMFVTMLERLKSEYGRSEMFDVIDVDAGLTSLANATHVVEAGYHYIFGLKGNQSWLFAEAKALLLPMAKNQEPEVQTPWEARNGKRIRRSLWRTGEMAGIRNSVGRWSHLRQTWLVRQETKAPNGDIEIEDRIFLTSLEWDALTPEQILLVVRNHWGVEVTFNSLDLQWREDSAPWCTYGSAIWALGVIRLMAYNTAQLLRRRRLRKKRGDGTREPPIRWRSLFKIIEKSFELDADLTCPG